MDWLRQGCIFHDTESTFFVLKKAKKGRERKKQNKRNQRSYNNGKHKRE